MDNCLEIKLLITTKCNLSCKYCFINKTSKNMSKKTIVKSLDFIYDNIDHANNTLIFDLFGGEPLLYLNKVIFCAQEIKKRFKRYSISITTNGVLLDEKCVELLINNNISIAISLDGPKNINNLMRISKDDKYYETVLNNINFLKKRKIPYVIGCTLGSHNILNPEKLMSFFIKLNPSKLSFNLLIGDFKNPAYVDPIKYSEKLTQLYKLILIKKITETTLINFSNSLKNKSSFFCFACGKKFVFTAYNEIYACQAGVNIKLFKIGDIINGFNQNFILFKNRKVSNYYYCNFCDAKYLCRGGCLINAYYSNKDLKPSKESCVFFKNLYNCMLNEKL